MYKNKTYILFLLSILFISGCTNEYKNEIMKEELTENFTKTKKRISPAEATKVIEVNADNFKILKTNIPNMEEIKKVKILGAELNDVIALLTEATDQNIIFQLQSDIDNESNDENSNQNNNTNSNNSENNEQLIKESKIYVSASKIGFGKLLKKAVGDKLSIRYENDTYYLGYSKTVTLKIPSLAGLKSELKNTIETLGATNVVHDSITSSITFSAREKEYMEIMKYLEILRNNLYVIEYEISIFNVELKDNYNLGIDWDIVSSANKEIGFKSKTISNFSSSNVMSSVANIGAIFNTPNFTGTAMAQALTQFGKVESIQRPKLLGIAGTDVTLIDGVEEPYIKEIKTTAVGDSGVQTSTVSASALSGIKITLNSNILDGTVLTDISLDINDIVSYTTFTVDGTSYSQPKIQTRNIKSSMRVQPGVPIVISGLFKHKSDNGYSGIPGVANTPARLLGGSEHTQTTKTEMVIVVTPKVIKYVMK
ncbi:MAG: hypothetical protein U9N02_02250 [Campylobacterota bacterium]|nr:hypothetical protein [Campylobacterota bacterium]